MTIMRFDSLAAVRAFAGPDYEAAVVPPAARAVLSRFDEYPIHQTPAPLAHPASGDRNVYDRFFFNGFSRPTMAVLSREI